ncbi:hypothetical protein Syun_018008 [Stephania yunnanensis]|uniref:Uncharacterized protein n=1 Tax=Stephania yunnanensis TaxID=152371 RepID=A0AAP0ITQ6_9MAGN
MVCFSEDLKGKGKAMATTSSASASILDDRKRDLLKQAVYQKNGNIFFRTSIQKATANEQRQLDLAKSKLQNLDRL